MEKEEGKTLLATYKEEQIFLDSLSYKKTGYFSGKSLVVIAGDTWEEYASNLSGLRELLGENLEKISKAVVYVGSPKQSSRKCEASYGLIKFFKDEGKKVWMATCGCEKELKYPRIEELEVPTILTSCRVTDAVNKMDMIAEKTISKKISSRDLYEYWESLPEDFFSKEEKEIINKEEEITNLVMEYESLNPLFLDGTQELHEKQGSESLWKLLMSKDKEERKKYKEEFLCHKRKYLENEKMREKGKKGLLEVRDKLLKEHPELEKRI